MNSHGDAGDAAEVALNRISDSVDMASDTESTQDQCTESPDGISDAQAQPLSSAEAQSKQPKLDFSNINKRSDRHNFRKNLPIKNCSRQVYGTGGKRFYAIKLSKLK